MGEAVRIATWNIGSLYADYAQNSDYLKSVLQTERIDILCMQEVPRQQELLQSICIWGGFFHQVYHTTSASHVGPEHDMGIAVFSRFSLGQPEIFKPAKPTVEVFYNGNREYWHDKYFMAVMCTIEGKQRLVVTGHGFPFHRYGLENSDNYQIIQPSFRELDAWLTGLTEQYGTSMFCAAADFNITDPMRFMPNIAKQYRDIFHGEATRPSGRKTDAILVRRGALDGKKTNIQPPMHNGRGILDHNFIMAELQL